MSGIKTIETTYEIPAVPATTGVKKTYQCETCGSKFDSPGDAQRHFAREHSYVATLSLAGHLGDAEDLPTEIRGEQMYKFETKEGFEAFLGDRAEREWYGPGWYVLSTGFTRCGRCSSSHCGHNWKSLTTLSSYERNLTEYFNSVRERLQSARAQLGKKCPECQECGGHATGCIEETLKDTEDLRKVLVHQCGADLEQIIDGRCSACNSVPETNEVFLAPWTEVK